MPKSVTFSALVDRATKCRATAAWSPPSPASSQPRAEVALVMVSMVVKVLEAMMNSVSAGSRSRTASCRSAPSTLETKRTVRSRSAKARRASYAMAGPRSEPPIPMLTTFLMRLPVKPVHAPDLTRLGEGRHLVEDGVHGGDDVLAVDLDDRVGRCAQGGVQHRPVLGRVDLLAAEHRLAQLGHAGGLGQLAEQLASVSSVTRCFE
ncbi:hypothetical protein SAVIM40S_00387 [Streptomyces avidinii]